MTSSDGTGAAVASLVVSLLGLLIGLGLYVWLALALSKLFPRFGSEGWRGWVPVLNEAEILHIGGYSRLLALLVFVPGGSVVVVIFRVLSAIKMGRRLGKPDWLVVLAVVLPPLWATLLGSGDARPAAPGSVAVPIPVPGQGGAGAYGQPGAGAAPGAAGGASNGASAAGQSIPGQPMTGQSITGQPGSAQPAGSTGGYAITPPPGFVPAPPGAAASANGPAAPPAAPAAPAAPADHAAYQQPPTPPAPAAQPPAAPNPWSQPPVVSTPAAPASPAAPVAPAAPGAAPSLIGAPTSAPSSAPGEDVGETVVVDASAAARWELALDHGPTYQLIGTTIVLGRKPEGSDPSIHYLAVRDATRTLSKVHARLERDGESWRVRDLGSTNGVRVIDADGSEHPVVPGDGVELAGRDFVLGRVTMRVERLGGPVVPEEPRDESEWPTGERA